MPHRLLLLVMGCAAGGGLFAILAQQTAAPSLIVQVRDAVTSQPVPDATVRLFGSLVREVGPGAFSSAGLTLERPPAPADVAKSVTDARGRAEFTGIKPGSYTVEVRKPGWTSANTAAFSPIAQKRVRISAEPAGEQITFQLTRAARITGVAVDAETREPIPGLRLMSWRFHYQRGVRVPFTSGGWATTGPGGSFALDNLMPGEYLLQVLPQKLGQKRVRLEWTAGEERQVDTDFADRYWPGGVDAVAAVPLVVRAGEEADAGRIVAARTSHYRILVRVRRETGRELRMKEPYKGESSAPLWPRVLRGAPRGAWRSVDSGNSGQGYGASKSTFRTPTLFVYGEGHTGQGANARVLPRSGVVSEPMHAVTLSARREPGGLRRG